MKLNVRTVDLRSWGIVTLKEVRDGHDTYVMRGIKGGKFEGFIGAGRTQQEAFDAIRQSKDES